MFEPALAVTYPDGGLNTELVYESFSVENPSPGLVRTRVQLRDSKQPLTVCLVFDAYLSDRDIKGISRQSGSSGHSIGLGTVDAPNTPECGNVCILQSSFFFFFKMEY